MKKYTLAFFLMLCALPAYSQVTSVMVQPANPTISVGSSIQFQALDQNGNDVTATSIWATSNAGILSLTSGGFGRGITNGTASVTATCCTNSIPTPTFSPVAGTYSMPQTISLSDAQTGLTFRYTTDGTTPGLSSTLYNGSITITKTTTLKVIAVDASNNMSSVASATYTNSVVQPLPPGNITIIVNP